MTHDIYYELREFLDGLPGGYPETGEGVEIKILEKLFTPVEAAMAVRMTVSPEAAEAVAARCGLDEGETSHMLESMAKKGLLFRTKRHERVSYSAFQYIFGLYDFQVNTVDRELAELMEEYFPHLGVIKSQFRVVPVDSAVDATPGVATYDQIRDLVRKQEIISVTPCICRKEQKLLGRGCDRPSETCLSFGIAAEYRIEIDIGRRIGVEEALGILDLAEESDLVLCPTNSEDIAFICCCCGCCCGMLRVLELDDRPADQIRSSFQARIDADRCNGCAICLDPCQIGAILEADEAMAVDLARCLGCGLCVSSCPEQAISLAPRSQTEALAPNVADLLSDIAAQRAVI